VDENLSEVESSDSNNEIGNNQEYGDKTGTPDSGQAAPVVSRWRDVKW
jgi:hypothetical protein